MDVGPLRHRNFGLLWWAGLISLIGDWALSVALPIYILKLTHSATATSVVVAANLLPKLLMGAFAGAYVDRWDRRRVVVVINFMQTLVLLPLLAVDRADQMWIVVLVAFAESVLGQFFLPAESALLPKLVPGEQLGAANALVGLGLSLGRLIGPAIGGVTAVLIGLHGAALVDAATYVIAAVMCTGIRGAYRAPDHHKSHILRELGEGLRMIAGKPVVRAALILLSVTAIGEGMMASLFAVFVTRSMRGASTDLGVLMSAQAVGGVLGGLVAMRVVSRFRLIPLVASCLVMFGAVDVVIFNFPRITTALWPEVALFILVGIPGSVGNAAIPTFFQRSVADRFMGRVFSVAMVGQGVASLVGAAIAGSLGDRINVMTLLTWQGGGYVLAGLGFAWLARRYGEPPAAETAPDQPAGAASDVPAEAGVGDLAPAAGTMLT
jgi:MFS family permease